MFVIVDERELVTHGYAGRFDEEGVVSAGFGAHPFRRWMQSAQDREIEAVEAFLIGECPAREEFPPLIRRRSRAPVIAISEARSLQQTLSLFSAGVDDVVPKPVHVRELLARAHAIRRRAREQAEAARAGAILTFHDGSDPIIAGAPLALPRRERRLLEYLVSNEGRRISKQELASAIYGPADQVNANAVETHVSKLRNKLRARLAYDPIESQRYLGYMLRAGGG